jgi:diadenosine tetraphosphate (Ap4A) HIT family hydrolase
MEVLKVCHLHIVPRYKKDAVILKFGHGNTPGNQNELERLASKVHRALTNK